MNFAFERCQKIPNEYFQKVLDYPKIIFKSLNFMHFTTQTPKTFLTFTQLNTEQRRDIKCSNWWTWSFLHSGLHQQNRLKDTCAQVNGFIGKRYHDWVIKRPSPYCAGVQSPQSQDVFFRTESLNLPTGAFSTCIFLFVESLTCLTGLNLWQTLLSYCRKRGERAVSVAAVAFSFITFCGELNLTETK